MTLRRKMGLQITAMLVGLLLISGASLWGLNGLQEDYGAAARGYQELREMYEVGTQVAIAQTMLAAPQPAADYPDLVIGRLQRGLTRFEETDSFAESSASCEAVREGLNRAMVELRAWRRSKGPVPPSATNAVNGVLGDIRDNASSVRERVQLRQAAAEAKRRATITALGVLCGAVILSAVLLGLWQYRGVMKPLNRLTGAVRRVARGQFGVRILEEGMPSGADNEFAGLAADFNRMARELDGFYRELEQKVAAKSKELIRSERLASVGYLAAGVAHEINNPLGIISGYAEYALSEMRTAGGGGSTAVQTEIDNTLRVIRDEAFRCKDITAKLLSLARPGESRRQRIDLAATAEQVVSVLAGLRDFKDRTITVRAESRAPLLVDAVEGEIKQVLMNLLINALEATDDGGTVSVLVTRDGDDAAAVKLSVIDDGRGMTPETLEQVFEPFFTDRRARAGEDRPPKPGTGLGLSITHAIVQEHGGRITAHSEGLGRGSRFEIELPAAQAV
jgi:signal transduction histidine kinase